MARAIDAAVLMDRIYGPQRHIYDLTRKYYLLGRDPLIARLAPAPGDRVLEIGCGTGRNLVQAARRYPQARLFGVDISQVMLASAKRAIMRAGLTVQVRVAQADATVFDPQRLFGQPAFERVFVSYSLSMIPAWRALLDKAVEVLAPGGELHVVDFGDQRGLPGWFRTALRQWLAHFHVTPRDSLERELRRLAAANAASLTLVRPYQGYAQSAVIRLPRPGDHDPAALVATARRAGAL